MSKREARSFAAAGVDIDAPRAKRRREAPATSNPASDGKQNAETTGTNGDSKESTEDGPAIAEDTETVRGKGLQLWTALKDAVNKEGEIASFQFMRLPSKRQYPDYYTLIKHPIALEDIKSKLEAREYSSLKDIKHDFDTCFRNAKRYNMKESQIFKDAKFLHKLTTKEYSRITGTKEEGHEDGDGSDDEEKKKKPTLYRLLKTRLQKLVAKTDDDGRVLSAEFMELPNKKLWPLYYTIIKKPQCLGSIFKKVKRKEYPKPVDFANDVELVFSNALEFNQEHTQIWEDAVTLREYFRKLMSDLPEPYTISAYANSGEHPTKIKLKVPAPAAQPQPIVAPALSLPSSNSIVIPGSHAASTSTPAPPKKDTLPAATSRPANAVKSPSVTPVIPPTPAPPAARTSSSLNVTIPPAPAPIPVAVPATAPQAQLPAHVPTFRPTSFAPNHTGASNGAPYNAGAASHPPSLAPAPPKTHSIPLAVPSTSAVALTSTPAPISVPAVAVTQSSLPAVTQYAHPLKHAVVTTMPDCRRLVLDHCEGVRSWAMWLSASETAVLVSDVTFLNRYAGAEEDESSGDEEPRRQEEEEDEDEEVEAPPKKRGPGRPRKRGRPPKGATKKAKVKASDAQAGPLQVKLNGTLVNAREGETWEVQAPYGMSTLEIGEQGGMVWKVYLDRMTF